MAQVMDVDGTLREETPAEFRARVRSIGYGKRTRPRVHEGRNDKGQRTKATTDELGHTVTEHNNREDRVDVTIRAPHVTLTANQREERHVP